MYRTYPLLMDFNLLLPNLMKRLHTILTFLTNSKCLDVGLHSFLCDNAQLFFFFFFFFFFCFYRCWWNCSFKISTEYRGWTTIWHFLYQWKNKRIAGIWGNVLVHYENKPIQIYWKIYHQKKWKFSDKNFDIFHISAQKHRLWVLVRTASPRRF